MRPSVILRSTVVGLAMVYIGLLVGFTLAVSDGLPTGAWVGLGVVAVVVAAIAVATIALFERSERDAGAHGAAPARVSDGCHRLLVVADAGCEGADVCPAVLVRLPGDAPSDVFVVAPVIASPFHHVMDDETRERWSAGLRLEGIVVRLRAAGVSARGMVGSDLPLEAVQDALALFPADEIVVVAPAADAAGWSEVDLVARVEEAFGLPVSHVPVERRAPADRSLAAEIEMTALR